MEINPWVITKMSIHLLALTDSSDIPVKPLGMCCNRKSAWNHVSQILSFHIYFSVSPTSLFFFFFLFINPEKVGVLKIKKKSSSSLLPALADVVTLWCSGSLCLWVEKLQTWNIRVHRDLLQSVSRHLTNLNLWGSKRSGIIGSLESYHCYFWTRSSEVIKGL